jgi:hypothetical protein
MGDNVAPRLAAMLKPLLRTFFRTPAQAAALGLSASGGPRGVRGYLSDGDLGQPRCSTAPIAFGAVGGDVASSRGEWLWEQTEQAIESVLGNHTPD